jgi:hypothetical protein
LVKLIFPCGDGSTATTVRVTSTSNSAPAITIDQVYVQQVDIISDINTGYYVGSLTYNEVASCGWTTTSAPWVDFAADTDCTSRTVIGEVLTPDTYIPGFKLNVKQGTIMVVAQAAFTVSGADGACDYRLTDGTNYSGEIRNVRNISVNATTNSQLIGSFAYTAAQTGVTFKIQGGAAGGSPTCNVYPGSNTAVGPLKFDVYYSPSSTQKAVTLDNGNFDWISYTPTVDNITLTSSTFKYRRVNDTMEVSGYFVTNVVSAGTFGVSLPSGFQVDTSKISTSTELGRAAYIANGASLSGNGQWGVLFNDSSDLTKIFLCLTPTTTAFSKSNGNSLWGNGSGGAITFKVPIKNWTTGTGNSVLLTDFVTSPGSSNGKPVVYSASITNGGSCAVESSVGNWIASLSHPSTGHCSISFNSSIFSVAPHCVLTTLNQARFGEIDSVSTSAVSAGIFNLSGTAVDTQFYIICTGVK